MKKRVFVGAKPDERTVDRLKNLQRKFVNEKVFRIIPPENFHLTLVPPWYVKDARKPIEKINKFQHQDLKPITVHYNKLETGPGNKKRLIWLSAPENKRLELVKSTLHKLLKIKEEKRKFIPHITIARRNKKSKRPKGLRKKISLTQMIDNITLFESKLSPKGAEYEMVETFRLS